MNFKIVNKNESSDFSVTQVDDAGEVSVYEVYFKPEQKSRWSFKFPASMPALSGTPNAVC